MVPALVPAIVLFQRLAARTRAGRRAPGAVHRPPRGDRDRRARLQQTVHEEANRPRYRRLLYDFNQTLVRGNARRAGSSR